MSAFDKKLRQSRNYVGAVNGFVERTPARIAGRLPHLPQPALDQRPNPFWDRPAGAVLRDLLTLGAAVEIVSEWRREG